jgi:hypothetical protein
VLRSWLSRDWRREIEEEIGEAPSGRRPNNPEFQKLLSEPEPETVYR